MGVDVAAVGRTLQPRYRQSFLESPVNALFNDALRAHFDADLAVSHGFRYGTAIPAGGITLGQLYTCFPMTTPVARGDAFGQQLASHMERFLEDDFTPYPYDQEDGRVRSYSSNVEVTIDPTAKRGRRLVALRVDGEPLDYAVSGRVATADDGGRAQNTPADGPYPDVQPGVDYGRGEAYCEAAPIPRGNAFPEAGRNRWR